MRVYLLAEWSGFWLLPDDSHGGIYPGPYHSHEEACYALYRYADAERAACLSEPFAQSSEYAEGSFLGILDRHNIVFVDRWPVHTP